MIDTQTLKPDDIIMRLASVAAAKELPVGTVVGDQLGGLTFTDATAAALEARSETGWHEVRLESGVWTIIEITK